MPDDEVCEQQICTLEDIGEEVLLIKRFDRYSIDGILKRRHFEEFNQLFGQRSDEKYNSTYEQLAKFIYDESSSCNQADALKIFKRVLAFILIGNTDAHLKNFAMFHDENGKLSLTPIYDAVASAYYSQYSTLAFGLSSSDMETKLNELKPKHIINFALNPKGFRLTEETLVKIVKTLEINKNYALEMLNSLEQPKKLKDKLCDLINKRWNGTFQGIENYFKKRKKST